MPSHNLNNLHPSLKSISPPLINSSNPWATTAADLTALYNCPYTGAVTTRTSLLQGYGHRGDVHRYCFFDTADGVLKPGSGGTFSKGREDELDRSESAVKVEDAGKRSWSSVNTLGYSPIPLNEYLDIVKGIVVRGGKGGPREGKGKLFIISVTGTADEVAECYDIICDAVLQMPSAMHLAMEVNLSCPNIHARPPPAYEKQGLVEYLTSIRKVKEKRLQSGLFQAPYPTGSKFQPDTEKPMLPAVGIKTPPYTYAGQFTLLSTAILECSPSISSTTTTLSDLHSAHSTHSPLPCAIDFITATNTLGTSLLLCPTTDSSSPSSSIAHSPALPSESGQGIGGMAGPAIHPLALGNVASIRRLLDGYEVLKDSVAIIGIGGVGDREGAKRMRAVGADIVGVGTALGVHGVGIFEEVVKGSP